MSTSDTLSFVKLHGLGNDFVLVDGRADTRDFALLAPFLGDRRFGVGCDQVLVVREDAEFDLRMQVLNRDGSEAEMCGNGIRAFALWAWRRGVLPQDRPARIATLAGPQAVAGLADGRVRVDMGPPRLAAGEIDLDRDAFGLAADAEAAGLRQPSWPIEGPGRAVSMGNPHLVFRVPAVAKVPLGDWGPQLERDAAFPRRINIEFVEVTGLQAISVRVWERGAGATLACGTGACAAAVTAIRENWVTGPVTVRLPGGTLDIEWKPGGSVYMTGPATEVARGEIDLAALAAWKEGRSV